MLGFGSIRRPKFGLAFRNRLVTMGYTPIGGRPEPFASLLDEDIRKGAEVVKFSGAKVD